jgi:hypothetical protein
MIVNIMKELRERGIIQFSLSSSVTGGRHFRCARRNEKRFHSLKSEIKPAEHWNSEGGSSSPHFSWNTIVGISVKVASMNEWSDRREVPELWSMVPSSFGSVKIR